MFCVLMMMCRKYYDLYAKLMPLWWFKEIHDSPFLARGHKNFHLFIKEDWEFGFQAFAVYWLWVSRRDLHVYRLWKNWRQPNSGNEHANMPGTQGEGSANTAETNGDAHGDAHEQHRRSNQHERRSWLARMFGGCELTTDSWEPPLFVGLPSDKLFATRVLVFAELAGQAAWFTEAFGPVTQFDTLQQLVMQSAQASLSQFNGNRLADSGRFERA